MDMSKYTEKIHRHKWELLLFMAIFALGIFLRTYNFSSWLHFEIDQTYDFNIVSSAIENGPGNLPLLGPTAGGGRALRLGPVFYYLEYVSALIFGNTPTGHAILVLIFSILAMPLFYFFCKRYFSKEISLAILLVFAVSFYNVLYSRFSWSPNVLPFLIILSFFALLKSVDEDEPRKNNWFLIATASATIATQIHFNALFTIPAIMITFLLIKRPHFPIKTWLLAFFIVIAIYSPMIASDIQTKGENLQLFEKKIFKAKGSVMRFKISFLGDLQHNTLAYFFIVTGQGEINNKKIEGFTILDMNQPTKTFLINLSALIFFISGLILLIKNIFTEKNSYKKDFLTLTALWLSFSFLYFFSIINSYRMYPRFFLLVSPISIIFLGFIFSAIYSAKFWKSLRLKIVIISLLSLLLAISNISEIKASFEKLRSDQNQPKLKLEAEDVFPNTARITLSQQENIAKYISAIFKKNKFPTYVSSEPEYEPAFWYHLEKLGIFYYSEIIQSDPLYREANYFFIISNNKPIRAGENFILNDKKVFGSLTVYYFSANEKFVTNQRQSENEREKTEETINILSLPTWNKLF